MSRFGWHTLIITIVIIATLRIENNGSFDKSNGIIDNRSLMDRVSGWYFFKEHITTNFYTKSEKAPQMVNSNSKFEKDHTSEFEKHSQTVEANSNSKEKDQLVETGRFEWKINN